MRAARFEDIELLDISKYFVSTAQAWYEAFTEREAEVRSVLGDQYDDRQKGRLELIEGAQNGLLQRFLVSGTAPGS